MKPSLQLKTTQQLSLTPQLRQAIRLLQLSAVELQAEIQLQLESNPLLQQEQPLDQAMSSDVDDPLEEEPLFQDDWPSRVGDNDRSGDPLDALNAGPETLKGHLLWQLGLAQVTIEERMIGYALIDAIDDRGYLRASSEDIVQACQYLYDDMGYRALPTVDQIEQVIQIIQQFEPAGVAARNLPECLQLQLLALPESTPQRQRALQLLSQMQQEEDAYRVLKQADDGSEVVALLRHLTPAPGARFMSVEGDYIVPDVIVRTHRGRFQVELNPRLTHRLGINQTYANLLTRRLPEDDRLYLKQQLQEAHWFLKSVGNRQETLLKVARLLVELQTDFFLRGEAAMRPLILADVAQQLGVHESTVSRITTNKFMATPQGTYELKYFFSSHVGARGGGKCSSVVVRALIKQLVNAEDPSQPLSDSQLAERINQQGIHVARRTVAKYRTSLRILSSDERKQW